MYYDPTTNTERSYESLLMLGIPEKILRQKDTIQALGWYPIIDSQAKFDHILEYLQEESFKQYENSYIRKWAVQKYSVGELKSILVERISAARLLFSTAFAEIDARQSRPDRGIILALVDGTFPQEDARNLTPEQQQRIVDVGIMWELEEVAQVNRDMQAELLALEITEDMTLEQAQEITLRIANAKPWLPWREAQKP